MPPELDVIVPQHGQILHTIRFLESFRRHAPLGTRLILVDNGTPDEEFNKLVPLLKRVYCVVVRNKTNLGFVKATNRGIGLSVAPYVVLQNNDTEIYDGCYQGLRDVLDEHPKTGVVGAVSSPCGSWVSYDKLKRVYPEVAEVGGLDEAHHGFRAFLLRQALGEVSKVVTSMVPFFCVMLRQETLQHAGLLSEDYGVGLGDDDDYCAKLRSLGYEVRLDLGTYVFHNHRTTFRALYTNDEITAMQKENLAKYLAKWRGGK